MRLLTAFGLLIAALGVSGQAYAAPVALVGGDTRVQVTADLAGLGLTPGVDGAATIFSGDPLIVNFPVTGGVLDFTNLGGSIEHEGSGVTLTGGGNTVFAGNFVIDTINSVIRGDVVLNNTTNVGDDLELFSFDTTGATITDLDNPDLALLITATLAGALTDVFDAPDLTGGQFGLASTLPQPVPVPGAIGLFALGAGALGLLRRRRQTTTA